MSENNPGNAAASERVIKKYPNRRLYDTQTSAYITLAEVKGLVMQNEPIIVKDAKTGEDLTRSILLQIILEEEAGGAPMFTEAMLANIIRFYGHAMQGFMGSYLERNVQMFTEMQSRFADQMKGAAPDAWRNLMGMQDMSAAAGTYQAQSQQFFQQMQEQMQKQTEQMLAAFGVKRS
ncbi:polyhydroxyalkanoate synthesis repressor PhaR [Comamonas odontotermitis]|uniref:polyhydroxyalkanoate synthesis repressor PhaR n=1 Tax=Comamonas odontotermitis TaxID=379895 RepID=UPI00375050B1